MENELGSVIRLAAMLVLWQYLASVTIIYIIDKNSMIMNQLQVAKLSLRVIMNHLNEALFLRSDDGRLSYCNDLGVKIVKQSCRQAFKSPSQLSKYCNRLCSLDFLAKNFLIQDRKNSSSMQRDTLVMNTPFLKLHMNSNSQDHQINKTNQALSAREQINLS